MEKIITVQIKEETRQRLNQIKYALGHKTIDQTIKYLIVIENEVKKK